LLFFIFFIFFFAVFVLFWRWFCGLFGELSIELGSI